MPSTGITSYLPYHEPGIVTILTQSGFLLVLNIVNHIFDNLIFCGLVGQIFVGVAWGTPGGKLFDQAVEDVLVQLGYLGLILLVFEGGLQTNYSALKSNIVLSTAVALTGIAIPIALSFSLLYLATATPIQAFAAGAALCSTSLGTTFTILKTSGLSATRIGVVLTTAAMMDDIVGLVMVQVISNLGGDHFAPVTVLRPISVSIGLGIGAWLSCKFIVKPLTRWIKSNVTVEKNSLVARAIAHPHVPISAHTIILLCSVTGATYAGTSNLFAAYLAGASISWWDSACSSPATSTASTTSVRDETIAHTDALEISSTTNAPATIEGLVPNSNSIVTPNPTSGVGAFNLFYGPVLHRVFRPLFFASVGFAIPITELFSGPIIWRGIIYTILMLLAKLATGLWLIRFSSPTLSRFALRSNIQKIKISSKTTKSMSVKMASTLSGSKNPSDPSAEPKAGIEAIQVQDAPISTSDLPTTSNVGRKRDTTPQAKHFNRPRSLYPAAILGTAMTARGEIGFLIASLAETTGVFASGTALVSSHSSETYLIATWAILLCTIIGPVMVGTLVKRVRRLEHELLQRGGSSREEGPLGVWGVS